MMFLTSLCYGVFDIFLETFQVWRRLKSLKNRHEEKSKDWRFPLKNTPRSSLTVDPTRNSQTIVLDNYGSFHIFQRFALVADSPLWSLWAPPYKSDPYLSYFFTLVFCKKDLDLFLDIAIVRETAPLLDREDHPEPHCFTFDLHAVLFSYYVMFILCYGWVVV